MICAVNPGIDRQFDPTTAVPVCEDCWPDLTCDLCNYKVQEAPGTPIGVDQSEDEDEDENEDEEDDNASYGEDAVQFCGMCKGFFHDHCIERTDGEHPCVN